MRIKLNHCRFSLGFGNTVAVVGITFQPARCKGALSIWAHHFWIMNWEIYFWIKDYANGNIISSLTLAFYRCENQRLGQVNWLVQGHITRGNSWTPCLHKLLLLFRFGFFSLLSRVSSKELNFQKQTNKSEHTTWYIDNVL